MRESSGDIVSTAKITVRPEKCKEFSLTISSLLDRIRCEEGCYGYRFFGEEGNRNSFILIGEWATREAWDNHLKSDNFAVLLGSLRLLSSRSKVEFKVLSHVTGSEAITRARCQPMKEMRTAILIS